MEFILERADYHIHTYYSDGTLSPADVVDRYHRNGYEHIAITDHDGVGGVSEAKERAKDYGMELIPGIELSTRNSKDVGLHILGYGIDINNKELSDAIKLIRDWRQERNRVMLNELGLMGYPLKMEDLQMREGQDFIGKPIFARAMIKKGYINDMKEAFGGKVFGSARLNSIRKKSISSKDAVNLIRGAGGYAVLAHPGEVHRIGFKETDEFYKNIEHIIAELKEQGLYGLECYYPKHTGRDTQMFLGMAEKYGLKVTKGSDFHDPGESSEH